jgi:glycosyltransferase involved in cell wall biosynthesis
MTLHPAPADQKATHDPHEQTGTGNMTIGVCITTRHRPELLLDCLRHLRFSSVRSAIVVVSDDSTDPDSMVENRRLCAEHKDLVYVVGPKRGVCANRNNALDELRRRRPVDLVAFLDDDALVATDYFQRALDGLELLSPSERARTIMSGVRVDESGTRTTPTRLDFSGYFVSSKVTEVAGASYAIYPFDFFDEHRWDDLIYFGYEDAELSLRAIRDGYSICHSELMELTDAGRQKSSMMDGEQSFDRYNFSGEAARLYVGVKRFKDINRNLIKLSLFLPIYFVQLIFSLIKRRSLSRLPELLRLSNVRSLLGSPAE